MRRLVLILVILLVFCMPIAVRADNVGVVADPAYGLQPPWGFTLTDIGNNQILADWNAGNGNTEYELRRSLEQFPTSRTEGTLIYAGSNTDFTDTTDELGLDVGHFYSLWGSDGVDWTTYVTASIGGEGLEFLAWVIFAVVCLGLTVSGYALHRGSLALGGATAWLIFAGFAIAQSGGTWNLYMGMFWLGLGMLIVSAVEGVLLNRGREQAEDEIEYGERIDEAFKDMDENIALRQTRRRERR